MVKYWVETLCPRPLRIADNSPKPIDGVLSGPNGMLTSKTWPEPLISVALSDLSGEKFITPPNCL
jgi:hypothetical protein